MIIESCGIPWRFLHQDALRCVRLSWGLWPRFQGGICETALHRQSLSVQWWMPGNAIDILNIKVIKDIICLNVSRYGLLDVILNIFRHAKVSVNCCGTLWKANVFAKRWEVQPISQQNQPWTCLGPRTFQMNQRSGPRCDFNWNRVEWWNLLS